MADLFTTLGDLIKGLPRVGLPSLSSPDQYTTALSPDEERRFQQWARRYGIRMEPGWNEDYDMRGLWKSSPDISPDPRGHWPDWYKKPFHPTFSNESIYATPDAPHWEGYRLITPAGNVVADETPESPVTLTTLTGSRKRKK